jgi:hypothetical protein
VRVGAGAYVCGEETALLASIQGRRGIPRPRPPFPAQAGLWGAPTLINNVETLATVPVILGMGGEAYAAIGSTGSPGTKVFALSGAVRNTGLVEVPLGTSLRTIVETIGGGALDQPGVPGGGALKAIQIGGPSGGCIPADQLDTPVDDESLRRLGARMGSGGMVVIDSGTAMPELARHFMAFSVSESCGKCVPCRAGTVQLEALLERFLRGQAQPADLGRLEELCAMVRDTSLCGLGQAAPSPVLSTLRWFRGDMCGVSVPGMPAVAGGPADSSTILTWFIDRYSPANQATIIAAYKARGYTHFLVSWPDSRVAGGVGLRRFLQPALKHHQAMRLGLGIGGAVSRWQRRHSRRWRQPGLRRLAAATHGHPSLPLLARLQARDHGWSGILVCACSIVNGGEGEVAGCVCERG